MKTPLLAAMALVMATAGCSRLAESRLNPFNWFGGSRSEPVSAVEVVQVRDPRPLVAQVSELRIEQTPGGAIMTAVGVPPTQGWWDAELVLTSPGGRPVNGVLVFDFRIERPADFELQGPPRSRAVTVGTYLSNFDLSGVTGITVRGQLNQRSLRR